MDDWAYQNIAFKPNSQVPKTNFFIIRLLPIFDPKFIFKSSLLLAENELILFIN